MQFGDWSSDVALPIWPVSSNVRRHDSRTRSLTNGILAMLIQWLGQWGLKRSEREIMDFLLRFQSVFPDEKGHVMGMAALLHFQIEAKNPEFRKIIRSLPNENIGQITNMILEFNRLLKELTRARRLDEAVALRLWIVTLRCMSSPSFQHHGIDLWRTAAHSFAAGEAWIKEQIRSERSRGNSKNVESLVKAFAQSRFIPPQFVGGDA